MRTGNRARTLILNRTDRELNRRSTAGGEPNRTASLMIFARKEAKTETEAVTRLFDG